VRRLLAVLAAAVVPALTAAPAPALPASAAAPTTDVHRFLYLNHGVVDPTRGMPAVPPAFSVSPARATTWLVQLQAPVTAQRLTELARIDADALGYLPMDAYAVRASALQVAVMRSRTDVVRAVVPLQPWYKVRDEALRAPRGTALRVLVWPGSNAGTVAQRLQGTAALRAVSDAVLIGRRQSDDDLARIADDPDVEFVGVAGTMVPFNTDARWVTETAQRDNWFVSDPVGGSNSLGLPGQGIDGSGEAVSVADTGSDYFPDRNGMASDWFSDCTDPLHPTVATCKLADRTFEAVAGNADPHDGIYHQNRAFGLPGSGVHRKMEAYFDLVGDGDPNNAGPGGQWQGDSGPSTHGTHTSGSVAANRCDPCSGSIAYQGLPHTSAGDDSYDGLAPQSRLVFQDIGDQTDGLSGLPGDVYQLWDQAYDLGRDPSSDEADFNNGASDDDTVAGDPDHAASVYQRGITPRIHSDSWGSFVPEVSLGNSPRTDDFVVTHEDFLPVVAAGNAGPDSATIGEPATSKDVLTVGATANGRLDYASLDTLANFSSHGAPSILALTPSPSGEPFVLSAIKPDVSTPGLHNVSPKGGTDVEAQVLQGTSMSAPTAAGAAALVRQYLEDGFGPQTPGSGYAVGTRNLARGIAPGATHDGAGGVDPTAALVKAILVASSQRMRGFYSGDDGSNQAQDGQWPSGGQGWGRVDLASALHFGNVPSSPDLWLQDVPFGLGEPANPGGIKTGDDVTYTLNVAAGQPLKVILDWSDPGGLASTIGVGPEAIVNQLQLQVDAPGGTMYCGNTITTMQPSHAADDVPTSTPGACALPDLDLANNVQGVYLPSPAAGTYTVHVIGAQVNQPQTVIGTAPVLLACAVTDLGCRQGYALAATGRFSDSSIVDGGTVPAVSAPSLSSIRVDPTSNDAAVVRWCTASPSTSSITMQGSDGDTHTVADVYSRSSFEGLSLVNIETQGADFLDVPVYQTDHEVKLTGLHRGSTYTVSVASSNAAGTTSTPAAARFTTPADVFSITAGGDTANFFETTSSDVNIPGVPDPTSDTWGTSSQMYSGQTPTTVGLIVNGSPGQVFPVVGAFKFSLPQGVDLGSVTGAAVILTTRQDLSSRVLDIPHHHLDLLDTSVDSTWGPGTPHSTVDNAAAAAQVAPASSSLRDVPFADEAFDFTCGDLTALLGNLKSNSQAAFRLTADTPADDSLYAWETGFARRASGLELRPRLVLFRGTADPLAQPAAATAPQISDVRAERLDGNDAVVYWRTDIASSSLVLYRPAGSTTSPVQVGSPAYTTLHEVALDNLGGAALDFAVRSTTASGHATTGSGGSGRAYQLPASLTATPPAAPAATTHASSADWSVPTETQPTASNRQHGDGFLCKSAVLGVTPGLGNPSHGMPNGAAFSPSAGGAAAGIAALSALARSGRRRRRRATAR